MSVSAKMRRRRRRADRLKRVRTERVEDALFFAHGTFPASALAGAMCSCGARARSPATATTTVWTTSSTRTLAATPRDDNLRLSCDTNGMRHTVAPDLTAAELSPHLRPGGGQPAPRCTSCRKRHLPGLPCWRGKYAQRVTAHVLITQGRRCWICGGRAKTSDHVQARSLGGTDADENLRPACSTCNSRRGNRPNPFPPAGEAATIDQDGISPRWRSP